ncbi:hypothetical protein Hanom_Chr01g00027011 [Helianthus anomalus]
MKFNVSIFFPISSNWSVYNPLPEAKLGAEPEAFLIKSASVSPLLGEFFALLKKPLNAVTCVFMSPHLNERLSFSRYNFSLFCI